MDHEASGRVRVKVRSRIGAVARVLAIGAAAGLLAGGIVGHRAPEVPQFGVTLVNADGERRAPADWAPANGALPSHVVVLVHGLDDPGWMWRDVIPALQEKGFVVARMEYPNDGPISCAADLLASELMGLRRRGVERVDIIGHSMGGLVTRDVLTRAAYYGGSGAGSATVFPAVGHFIMCGTPNHGSCMARLRAVTEIKEHVVRAFAGEGTWLGGLCDGAGEAASDLLPESDFLEDLNSRALPLGVRHTIIAGRVSPVTAEDAASVTTRVCTAAKRAGAPAWLRDLIEDANGEAASLLDETVRGLGDGCVTLDSARLDGVDDFVIVEGNHVSMIVNLMPVAHETPPAVSIILDRLGDP